jgi:uncharacterized protein YhaN
MTGQRIQESASSVVTIGNGPAFEGVEPEVFSALFAIGLDELSEIGTKDWGVIESRLLGHYASEAVVVPSEVLDHLGREMAALYRENGRGNYELKTVLAALKSGKELRRDALKVLEAQEMLGREADALDLRIAAVESDMVLWQQRAEKIAKRPDLIAELQELDWLTQRTLPYDHSVLPDSEAFETYESHVRQHEAHKWSLELLKRSGRQVVPGIPAVLVISAALFGMFREPFILVFGTLVLSGILWRIYQCRKETGKLEREIEKVKAGLDQFMESLPFKGPRGVEESLELLEARERSETLRLILSKDSDYVRFRHWLPEKRLEEAAQLAMKARLEVASLENERLTLELKSRRQEALTDLELAEREILMLESRRAEIAAQWDRLLLETLVVEEADLSFRERRRYDFLTNASLYLSRLTCGRYAKILSRPEAPGLFVIEGPAGIRNVDNRLSRGTREQVYLALKLGLVDALDPEGRFPLLLDDVAVNFDHRRREGFDALLGALMMRRQIFYFTCREGHEVAGRHGGGTEAYNDYLISLV